MPFGASSSTYLSFDYFRTGFNHKVVYDWDSGMANGMVDIYDFTEATKGNNRAYTDTYQVDLSVEPIERFTAIATFRYSNAMISMKNQGLVEAPMTSRYKAVLNLQYAMPMNKWMFDFTAQLNGPCKVPAQLKNMTGKSHSEVYPMMFAQITKKFSAVDVYVGVDLLLGMFVGAGIFLLIAAFALIAYRKEGMGLGDVKLMGMLGLFFGMKNIFQIFILSFIIGAVVSIILLLFKILFNSVINEGASKMIQQLQ